MFTGIPGFQIPIPKINYLCIKHPVLKKKTYYIAFLVISGIIILLLLKNYVFALLTGIMAVMLFAAWKTLLDYKEKEVAHLSEKLENLSRQNEALSQELDELRHRRWNVSELKHILDLGVMEIHTSFTRTWDNKFKHKNKDVHFIGALKVKVSARYGIDLKQLRLKFDKEARKLYIANLQPKLLSFNDINYIWEIAEILEYKKPFIGSNYWRKSKELQELGAQIKEEFRLQTHEEVKNGPEEMQWILEPIKTHLINTVEWLFKSPGIQVEIISETGEGFLPLETFFEKDKENQRFILQPPEQKSKEKNRKP